MIPLHSGQRGFDGVDAGVWRVHVAALGLFIMLGPKYL